MSSNLTYAVKFRAPFTMTMRRTLLASTLLAVVACGEKSTAPKETPVSTVLVQAPTTALQVGDAPVVTATVRDAAGVQLNGRLVQWQSSAPSVISVTTSSGPASTTITAVAPGTATVSATSGGVTGLLTFNVSAAPVTDFAIIDAQWTQGVQQADGGIPMVLDGNAAVLNVNMSSTNGLRTPGAVVLTIRDGSGAVVRTDTVRPRAIDGNSTYADPAAQFLLPASVLRQGLTWEVRRDPQRLLPDADALNDNFPRAGPAVISTITLPPMRLRFVPIALATHGSVMGNVTVNNVAAYLPTFNRVYPRGQVITSVGSPLVSAASFGNAPSGGAQAFWTLVLSDLDLARVADANFRDAYWLGVVAPPAGFNNTAFGGFSYIPSSLTTFGPGTRTSTVVNVGWFSNTGQTADLVPHELAHAIGRRHTPCGGPTGVDPGYPFPDGRIGVPGHDVYGWATGAFSNAPVRASSSGDLMGYCFPAWISPYTYYGMLAARAVSAVTAGASSDARDALTDGAPMAQQREPVLVVRGTLDNGRIALLPAVTIDGFPTGDAELAQMGTSPAALRAAHHVELLDASGRVLRSQPIRFTELDHAPTRSFVAAIPLRQFPAATLASIRVRGADAAPGTAMLRRPVGAAALRAPSAPDTAVSLARVSFGASGAPRSATTGSASMGSARPTGGRTRFRAACGDSDTRAIVLQDAQTFEVIASATAANLTFDATIAGSVYISCSDGVVSRRSRVRVPPPE